MWTMRSSRRERQRCGGRQASPSGSDDLSGPRYRGPVAIRGPFCGVLTMASSGLRGSLAIISPPSFRRGLVGLRCANLSLRSPRTIDARDATGSARLRRFPALAGNGKGTRALQLRV